MRLDKGFLIKNGRVQTVQSIRNASPWHLLDVPLEQLGDTQKLYLLLRLCRERPKGELEEKLEEAGLLAEIKTLGDSQDDVYTLVFYHKIHTEEVQNLFKEFSVGIQDFPGFKA